MKLFRGRMNRATYLCSLGMIITLLVVFRPGMGTGLGVMFAMSAFRLHDIGLSSKWSILPMIAAMAAVFLPVTLVGAPGVVWGAVVGILMGTIPVILLGLMIWLASIPGQPHENRFGEPPRPGVTWFKGRPKPVLG